MKIIFNVIIFAALLFIYTYLLKRKVPILMRGGHNDAFYIYNAECMQKISDFLKRHIK
ncbi:MAG: hypothetical protein WBI28_03890 [Candidatus Omnitrophota bacterium]